MDPSLLIAKLLGPVMVAASVSMLVNPSLVQDLVDDVADSPLLLYIAGVMALVAGLLIVNFHNFWVADWRVIITVFGWIAIVAGILRMVFPAVVINFAEKLIPNTGFVMVTGVLNLLLGGFLSYMGYLA